MIEILLPIEDTCISKYNATINFGKSDSLLIGSSSSENDYYRALLKFDISSIFSKVSITRVLLRLYVYKKEKTGQQEVTAYKLLENFKEMEANWNNQPSHEEVGYTSTLTDINLNGYFDIDVTSIINQWLNDKTETVHGIEVIASQSASSFIWFRSREYTQDYMWPSLIVEYDDSKLVTDSKQNGDVSIESSFKGFDLHKRITYINIPDLPENHIIYGVSKENDFRNVLANHNAILSSIKTENYNVDLGQALITDANSNGTILLVNTDTSTGISITQCEPNETVVVKVVRNGETTIIDKTQWNSYDFKINDEILVECTSQDKVVTNVYKITISKKTLRHVTVSTETELTNALSDDSVGHISLLNNITLTKALSIDKYIILDSDGTNNFTLTTPNVTLGIGADEGELNNLIIDGELIIDIGPYASITLHNVTALRGTRVLSGDINSIHLYGIKTPILRFFGNAKVILDEDTSSATPIKSVVGEIILTPPAQGTPVQILQIIGSKVNNLKVQSEYSNISIQQDASITNLNIQAKHSIILIDQGALVTNLAIDGCNTNIEIDKGGNVKTVQIDAGNTSLTLDNGSSVETLNLNSNNLTIDGKNITHVNIQSGVTDISTICVKGYEQTDTSIAEANNSLAVIFALTQSNIITIKLDGVFEGVPITGKSIANISGAVDNKIVTVDDTKVLKFAIIVYSIIKVNLLPGIYDEALEIKRPLTLQGNSDVILKQRNEKIATETSITISADDVKIIGLEIRDWNIGIENKQDKQPYKNIIISDNIIYSPQGSNYGIYMGYDAEAFLYPSDDPKHLDDMIDFKGLTIINNQILGYNNHAMIIESIKASEGKLIIGNNDIYDSKGYGIWINTSKNINVQNNKIHENAVYGIYLSSTAEEIHSTTGKVPSDIAIINNELTDNMSSDLSFDSADLTTIEIAENSITSKILNGNLIENNLTTTTNAPNNWWGTAYKPTIQSKIVGPSNFVPYYVNASKTILSNVKTDIHVNPNYTDGNSELYIYGYNTFSNIKEALEKAKEFS
ncbi:DNRLRE domain-containing protein [Clostridium sp. JS66]|uniref:DNRLRE domain-containing protein n=1 Tax=Clostridium sp. JS66 TaxID=3064705 RepID=UPI00399AD28D